MRPKIGPRIHFKQKTISFISALRLLALFVALIFAVFISLLVFTVQKHKAYTTTTASSLTPTFAELYGFGPEQHGPASCSGPCQLLLLSYYNSKASLLARLLMLMGVFAGDPEQLSVDVTNKLRWWELKQSTTLHDFMFDKYAAPGSPAHLAQDFNLAHLSASDLDYYQDRVQGIIRYLGHHKPWLIKDPRLVWFAPLWLERLEHPLCIILVGLQPWVLAQQQSDRKYRRQQRGVSSHVHLERWTNSTLSALQACFAVPTLIVPNTVLQPPLLQPFLAALQQHLQSAGVPNIHIPSESALQQHYISHLYQNQTSSNAANSCSQGAMRAVDLDSATAGRQNATADGTALLQETCHWLPAANEEAYSRLPVPTRALVEALTEHLEQHLARPKVGFDYNKVAARVFSAYSTMVKQLVHQQPGHRSQLDHHSVSELIHNALRYVSADHKL